MATNWRETDERLIRRGELILELGFVENYQAELDAMNHAKEGRPYKLTPTYIQFLTAIRYLYQMPYRQLEGFTRACAHAGEHVKRKKEKTEVEKK